MTRAALQPFELAPMTIDPGCLRSIGGARERLRRTGIATGGAPRQAGG